MGFPSLLRLDPWGTHCARGIIDEIRQQMEGYLAQKWVLTELMPSSLFIALPNFRLFDKNSDELSNFNFSKSDDNQSLIIDFTPSESPNRFTFQIGVCFGETLDGAVSQPESFSLAYGRPLTRLDRLQAWWDFDDQNDQLVTEFFGRFPGTFIDNNISGTFYEVTYAPGVSGNALSFPGNAWVRTLLLSSLGISSTDLVLSHYGYKRAG